MMPSVVITMKRCLVFQEREMPRRPMPPMRDARYCYNRDAAESDADACHAVYKKHTTSVNRVTLPRHDATMPFAATKMLIQR